MTTWAFLFFQDLSMQTLFSNNSNITKNTIDFNPNSLKETSAESHIDDEIINITHLIINSSFWV